MDNPDNPILDITDDLFGLSDLDLEAMRDIHPDLATHIDERLKDIDYE